MLRVTVSNRSYPNWPRLEKELRDQLDAEFDSTAVDRVMARIQRAYMELHFPSLVDSLPAPAAEPSSEPSAHHRAPADRAETQPSTVAPVRADALSGGVA